MGVGEGDSKTLRGLVIGSGDYSRVLEGHCVDHITSFVMTITTVASTWGGGAPRPALGSWPGFSTPHEMIARGEHVGRGLQAWRVMMGALVATVPVAAMKGNTICNDEASSSSSSSICSSSSSICSSGSSICSSSGSIPSSSSSIARVAAAAAAVAV